eukprot:1972172-Amphidinium_carterae.1
MDLFHSMLESSSELTAFSYAAATSALEKGTKWQSCLQVVSDMRHRGIEANVVVCSNIMTACEKATEWQRAIHLWNTMQEKAMQPDIVCVGAAMSALGKGDKWEEALTVMDECHTLRLPLNAITCSTALAASVTATAWEVGLEVFRTMRDRYFIQPTVVTCGTLMHSCSLVALWSRAIRLLGKASQWSIKPNE